MNEDDLLRALGARAREEEDEVVDGSPPIEGEEASALFDAVLERTQKSEPFPVDMPSPADVARPRSRRIWLVGLAAALAVALVSVSLLRGPQLPDYSLVAGAGDQTHRTDPVATERARYSQGSRVHLIARPAVDVAASIKAHVLVRQGKTEKPVEAPLQISATGAVRLDAVAGETLLLPVGEGELVLVVEGESGRVQLVHPFIFSP